MQTSLGNFAFSCMEGARPYLFDILRVPCGTHPLRSAFLAATVPGSLRVFSVVADSACQVSGRMVGTSVVLAASNPHVTLTVMVAGIHKHFPEWDLPIKTDTERQHSINFWGQEWKEAL